MTFVTLPGPKLTETRYRTDPNSNIDFSLGRFWDHFAVNVGPQDYHEWPPASVQPAIVATSKIVIAGLRAVKWRRSCILAKTKDRATPPLSLGSFQTDPEVLLWPSDFLEAWGARTNKTIMFLKMCGVLAVLPQASKNRLAKNQLRGPFEAWNIPHPRSGRVF